MKKLLAIVLTLVVLTLAFASCGAKAVTSITIDEGLAREYALNSTPDFSDVKATIKYNDETTKSVTASELTFGALDTTTPGTKQLEITYAGFTIKVDVVVKGSSAPQKTITSIIVTEGIEESYEIGSTPDFSGIKATVAYSDGTTKEVTAADLTIGTVDTSAAGVKKLHITYDGFTAGVDINVVAEEGVKSITITAGIEESYEVGANIDFSGIKATVTYTNNETKVVTAAELTIGSVDTSTAGIKELTIEYEGFSIIVNITVAEKEYPYYIMGADLPSSITNRKNTYAKAFTDATKAYRVGDDNPYVLALIITALNDNDDVLTIDYIGTSMVYLVTNEGETLVGTDYVVIDEEKHTFDFTEQAIGKTFRIVTRPSEGVEDDMLADVTASHVVEVVDGYNVTNAKELNLITNGNSDQFSNQLEVVSTFLINNGINRPENLKALVFHNDITVTTNDIPEEYLFTYTQGGVEKKEFNDFFDVYHRELNSNAPSFAIYGNYYTLYSYNLPCVVPNGIANQIDDYSSAQLFRFIIPNSELYDGADLSPFYANLEDLGMRDSNPNSNDESQSERSMRGLIGIKSARAKVNITNTNIEKFFMSTCAEYDYTTFVFNGAKLTNAWQCHVFTWSDNEGIQLKNEAPWSIHRPISIEIINSSLTKCGGPVILSQSNNPDRVCNSKSKTNVTIDSESTLESWVTGKEAWFVANNVTPLAAQIQAMSGLLQLGGGAYQKVAKYVKEMEGETFFNLMYVNMISGDNPLATGDVDGKVTIGNNTVVNQNDSENPLVEAYEGIGAQIGVALPVFQSSAAGTCIGIANDSYNGVNSLDIEKLMGLITSGTVTPTDAFMASLGAAPAETFDGDYITIYYNGMAILLEYIHE